MIFLFKYELISKNIIFITPFILDLIKDMWKIIPVDNVDKSVNSFKMDKLPVDNMFNNMFKMLLFLGSTLNFVAPWQFHKVPW